MEAAATPATTHDWPNTRDRAKFAALPPIFSYSQAREAGLSQRRIYWLRDHGLIEPLAQGTYRRSDLPIGGDPDLIEIAARAPLATLCLTSALARHDLTDAIPSKIDTALPRGTRRPPTVAPVRWHLFAQDTLRHTEGPELAHHRSFRLDGQIGLGGTSALATPPELVTRRPHADGPVLPEGAAGAPQRTRDSAVSRPTRETTEGRVYLDLQRQARSDARPFDELLPLYTLEGFLARLATSEHARNLVLKGGLLLAAYDARRPTRDADFAARRIANDVDEVTRTIPVQRLAPTSSER